MTSSKAGCETASLAAWIAGTSLADVPTDVVERATDCIVDSLGCMVAGAAAQPCRLMLDVLARHAPGDVTVPGTGRKLSVLGAAYLGSQAANALDFDDSFRAGAPSHPGATIVPPALAVGELQMAKGADLLLAVIIGYEVSLRVGRAVQPTPARKAAVYGFSTWQVFGAVSAAASLLGLTDRRTVDAIGLAAVHAPVPSLRKLGTDDPRPYPWIKNTYGAASEAGVLAALLASEGYVGSRNIFEGDHGFWIMSGSDRYRPELLTRGLGSDWLLREVGFKQYGCCRWTHTMLDAISSCANDLDPASIATVEVHGFEELARLGGSPPTSIVDAQFHAPHLAALMLLGRSPEQGLREVDLADPQVADLRNKVLLRHDPLADEIYYASGALPVRVVVRIADGRELTAHRENPTGSPAAGGYGPREIDAKFLGLTTRYLGTKRAAEAIATVRNLQNLRLTDILNSIA